MAVLLGFFEGDYVDDLGLKGIFFVFYLDYLLVGYVLSAEQKLSIGGGESGGVGLSLLVKFLNSCNFFKV